MSYNLWTDGLADVDRIARLFNKTVIGRDPLSGVVDGVNQYFYTQYTPILSSPAPNVYTSGSAPLATSEYTLDYDAGLVTFNVPPIVQPVASYTTAKYSDTTVRSILVAGFDEMEGLWFRGLALSESVGSEVIPITESSGSAYITLSTGSDPQVGSIYWGQSRNQINLYAKCVQLAFYSTLMGEHALSDFIWTEAQGLRVDKSMTVRNLKLAYDALYERLTKIILPKAQYEWYGDALFGGAVYSPHTKDFVAHHYWQKASIEQNWRGTTPYSGERW